MSDPLQSFANGFLMESMNWPTQNSGASPQEVNRAAKTAAEATAQNYTVHYEGLLAHAKESHRLDRNVLLSDIKVRDVALERKDIAIEGKEIEIRKKSAEVLYAEGMLMKKEGELLHKEADLMDAKDEAHQHNLSAFNYADELNCLIKQMKIDLEPDVAEKITLQAATKSLQGRMIRRFGGGYPGLKNLPLLV